MNTHDSTRQSRLGPYLVSVWLGLNLLLALGIFIGITTHAIHAPALAILFGDMSGDGVESRTLATIDALALMFNGIAIVLCASGLVALWRGVVAQHSKRIFSVLAPALTFVQIVGFISDSRLEHRNLTANIISAILLLSGLWLTRNAYLSDQQP